MSADVWSVTSYKSLYTDGIDAERWNLLHSGENRVCLMSPVQCSWIRTAYWWRPRITSKRCPTLSAGSARYARSLGTDGFGRSDGRAALRDFFEVDARFIALTTLYELLRDGKIEFLLCKKPSRILRSTPKSRIRFSHKNKL